MPSSSLRVTSPLVLALALSSLAVAQPVKVQLEQARLEEGRSGTVQVVLSSSGDTRPVLLLAAEVELSQPGAQTRRVGGPLAETIHGLSLESSEVDAIPGLASDEDDDADRVVSLELRAIDDPGPAARQPLPDVVSTARGVPHRLIPLLARRTLRQACRPGAGRLQVRISWEAVVVPKETPEGIYELARVQRWLREEDSQERKVMGPRRVFRLTTRHWRQWRGEQRGELLLRPEVLEALPVYRGTVTRTLKVAPAAFGRAAAEDKAGFSATEAWRLPDDRWILQRTGASGRRYALVGNRQEAVHGSGDLSQVARDLSEGRPARLRWATHRGHPDLAVQVKQFNEATYTKSRALTWTLDLVSLRPFLDELGKTKLELVGGSIREPRRP